MSEVLVLDGKLDWVFEIFVASPPVSAGWLTKHFFEPQKLCFSSPDESDSGLGGLKHMFDE